MPRSIHRAPLLVSLAFAAGCAAPSEGAADAGADVVEADAAPLSADAAGDPLGTECASGATCGSGLCVDGMCCDTPCDGACESCGGGTCGPTPAGLDPDEECVESGATTCGTSGACDGAGACMVYAAGTSCGAPSCAAGTESSGAVCDGGGSCDVTGTASCAPYACGATACLESCSNDQDCVATQFCAAPSCVAKRPDGAACTGGNECITGQCFGMTCGPQSQPTLFAISPDDVLATVAAVVVITGTQLAANAVVQLAGVAVPLASCSYAGVPTSITCTVAPRAVVVRGDVTVTNPDGGTATRTDGLTFTGVLNETNHPGELDFCNLQFPSSMSASPGTQSQFIFGQVYEDGVTVVPGANANVVAELGVGPLGSDPTAVAGWTFASASFGSDSGYNDEYGAALPGMSSGAYAYTYRFSLDAGLHFTYCDDDGAGTSGGLDFSPSHLGTLTVGG